MLLGLKTLDRERVCEKKMQRCHDISISYCVTKRSRYAESYRYTLMSINNAPINNIYSIFPNRRISKLHILNAKKISNEFLQNRRLFRNVTRKEKGSIQLFLTKVTYIAFDR